MSDVFISYRRADAGWAGRLLKCLEERFDVFFDTEDIDSGDLFPQRSESALLQGVPAARRQACDSTGAAVVYVVQAQEGFGISRTESAYRPEPRPAAFACDRDRLHTNRHSLSPHRGDAFPFAKDMGEAMLGFVRANRHLLP